VEKVCDKKRDELADKVKHLEGEVLNVHQFIDNFTFQVRTSRAFLSHYVQKKWIFESGCTHHMAKDDSLFTSLDEAAERMIYIADDFSLDIVG
jgi:hypothetical protein